MAKATNSVVAELKMVPNQPLVLNNDGKPRSEDDLLAYGWVKFMETGDPPWIPRLPMVKSAVRAMDTVTALLASEQGGKVDVKKFVVAGGSKRGWTTWLTGGGGQARRGHRPDRDRRRERPGLLASITSAPTASGRRRSATTRGTRSSTGSGTKEYERSMRIEDPYFYRDRLTMPKFVVNASGDQYFPPDSSKFYFGDLPGRSTSATSPTPTTPCAGRTRRTASSPSTSHPEQEGAAEVLLGDGRGRLDPREDRRQAERGEPVAGDEPQGPRLPAGGDRRGLQEVAPRPRRRTASTWRRSPSRKRAGPRSSSSWSFDSGGRCRSSSRRK